MTTRLHYLGSGGGPGPQTRLPVRRTLEAAREGDGWVFLDRKEPVDDGKVAAYKIERRQRPSGPWTAVRMPIDSEITLSNQERGKEWEYRVIAVNKAGEGQPSNTVMAVL